MPKRLYRGMFHKMNRQHLQCYVNELATRQGLRDRDTIAMMGEFVAGVIGQRLTYKRLVGK